MTECLLILWMAHHACTVPTPRAAVVVRQFHVATGYPHGRKGYVVDHIIPLCACGSDTVENMQWQTIAASKVKDRQERLACQALRKIYK